MTTTSAGSLVPQTCTSCGDPAGADGASAPPSYVYAVGRIEHRFPSLSIEKEFAQAAGRIDTKGLTDRQLIHAVLSRPENRYLVRHLCWVMSVAGLETYLVVPRDLADLGLLVDTLRPSPRAGQNLEVLIGIRGPIASPEMCNGLMLPVVGFDQIYSFDREDLIKAIPRPDRIPAKEFGPAAEDLLDRVLLVTDNAGDTLEHRALNYMVTRYHAPYAKVAEAFGRNASLSSVEVQRDSLGVSRSLVKVILSFTDRTSDVTEKWFLRIDVTDEFPFLVTKLSQYFDR